MIAMQYNIASISSEREASVEWATLQKKKEGSSKRRDINIFL